MTPTAGLASMRCAVLSALLIAGVLSIIVAHAQQGAQQGAAGGGGLNAPPSADALQIEKGGRPTLPFRTIPIFP